MKLDWGGGFHGLLGAGSGVDVLDVSAFKQEGRKETFIAVIFNTFKGVF